MRDYRAAGRGSRRVRQLGASSIRPDLGTSWLFSADGRGGVGMWHDGPAYQVVPLVEEAPLKIPALTLVAALAATGCSNGSITQNREAMARVAANSAKPQVAPMKGSEALAGTPEAFNAACNADLERARAQVAALKKLDAKTNGQAVLEAYDEASGPPQRGQPLQPRPRGAPRRRLPRRRPRVRAEGRRPQRGDLPGPRRL